MPAGVNTYSFVNGNDLAGAETVSGECSDGAGSRTIVVTGAGVMSDIPCFGSCGACEGCTDPLFAEYDPFAGSDNGSCGTAAIAGCTYDDAENYSAVASYDDGSCEFSGGGNDCVGDLDGDGTVATSDLLSFLSFFGGNCL